MWGIRWWLRRVALEAQQPGGHSRAEQGNYHAYSDLKAKRLTQ